MKYSPDTVDWAAILGGTFLYEDSCWTTCNGGFCCSNNHPDFDFQLIPTQGTTLLYMEAEYEFDRAHGKVPEFETHRQPPHELCLDFGGPRPLRLIQTPCHLLGKCHGVIDKPLLCRLYPFIPVLDVEGEVTDLVPASVFELTFDVIGGPRPARTEDGGDVPLEVLGAASPCTVRTRKQDYLTRWQKYPAELGPLHHPYVILYTQAARHFADNYCTALRANPVLAHLTGRDFWRKWELQHLGGRLIDVERLKRDVYDSYKTLVRRYGEFLI